jgi:hypothetical protein
VRWSSISIISINICFRCTSRWASSSIFFASSSTKFLASSSAFAAFAFADLDRRLAWTWKVSIHKGIFKLIDWPFRSEFFAAIVLGDLGGSSSRFAWTWKLLNYERIVKFICSSPFWVSFFFFRLRCAETGGACWTNFELKHYTRSTGDQSAIDVSQFHKNQGTPLLQSCAGNELPRNTSATLTR